MKKIIVIALFALMTSTIVQAQCGRYLNFENGYQAGRSVGLNETYYQQYLHLYTATIAKYSGICYEYAAGFDEGYWSTAEKPPKFEGGIVNDPDDNEVCHASEDPEKRSCLWE